MSEVIVFNMLRVSDRYYSGEINLEEAVLELEAAGSQMSRQQMIEALIDGGRDNVKKFPVQD